MMGRGFGFIREKNLFFFQSFFFCLRYQKMVEMFVDQPNLKDAAHRRKSMFVGNTLDNHLKR
jgi:hypothetical protein